MIPASQVQLRGNGYHQLLELKVNLSCDEDKPVDLFLLLEIQTNNYYFDYYELQVLIFIFPTLSDLS